MELLGKFWKKHKSIDEMNFFVRLFVFSFEWIWGKNKYCWTGSDKMAPASVEKTGNRWTWSIIFELIVKTY